MTIQTFSFSQICHSGEEDPLKELMAAMARLSIRGQKCTPASGTSKKDPKKCTKATVTMFLRAVSGKSSNAQVKTLKRRWDNVSSEDNVRSRRRLDCTSPCIKRSKIKTKALGKTKREKTRMYFVYKREEPEPAVSQEEENIDCKKTEEAEKTERAKPRRGGVTHRWVL